MGDVVDELRVALGDDAVVTGAALHERSAGIWGPARHLEAHALARPGNTSEVAQVLKICHRFDQPVVTHGGLTGVVDGARADCDDVVLSMERMNRIEEMDPLGATMIVQAGTPLQVVQEQAAEHGLMFPLDLGARGTATIGGNAATNAGGNRVIRYGMVRSMILGLEAVMADGTVLSSMNRMLKNNAGYDLKHLFIGTEGTLGVVTRLVLRLVQEPSSQDTALVAMRDFGQITAFLRFMEASMGGTLSAFEVMWRDFYTLVTSQTSGRKPPLDPEFPYFVLVEALGSDQLVDSERFQKALSEAFDKGLVNDAIVAKSQAERAALWSIRDDVVQLLELKPVFLFDVSLPISEVEAYVQNIRDQLTEQWPNQRLFVFGHLGDGNIHLAISAGPENGEARTEVERIVYQPLMQLGGSVSGEHGIGLEKKPYLSWCRSPAEIIVMKALKKSLDPRGILNPGKVFD